MAMHYDMPTEGNIFEAVRILWHNALLIGLVEIGWSDADPDKDEVYSERYPFLIIQPSAELAISPMLAQLNSHTKKLLDDKGQAT